MLTGYGPRMSQRKPVRGAQEPQSAEVRTPPFGDLMGFWRGTGVEPPAEPGIGFTYTSGHITRLRRVASPDVCRRSVWGSPRRVGNDDHRRFSSPPASPRSGSAFCSWSWSALIRHAPRAVRSCLLYTSDAADEEDSVDL